MVASRAFVVLGVLALSVVGADETVMSQGLAIDPDVPAVKPEREVPKSVAPRKISTSKRKSKLRSADEPPPCPSTPRASRPPAQSMPELFERMGESFARNPATGFNTFMGELTKLEGPAVQGITVSIDEERKAGLQARSEYLAKAKARGYRVVEDEKRLAYLRTLVDRLASRMRHRDRYPKIEVTLVDAPVSDGQSFPGGFLVFTSALLEEPDEATVAGVVAHELAHLDRGHLYSYVRRSKLMETGFARPANPTATFDQMFTQQAALFGMMFNPFRPEHENEADCTAVTWMYQEGYDPRALVGFFERLHDRRQDQPDNPFFSFGRTHPFSLDRRNHVLARLAQLQRWRPKKDLGRFAENLKRLEVHGDEAKKK